LFEALNDRELGEDGGQVCPVAWEKMVDRWLSAEWAAQHAAARQRRLFMPGVPHHQGNRNLSGYARAWVRGHVSILLAFVELGKEF
jgi:hypothetical protein